MTVTLPRDTANVPYFGYDGANNIVLLSPTAVVLANGLALQTTSLVGAAGLGFNGTTLDLLQTLAASGYGLGVQKVAPATSSTDYSANPRATTLVTAINAQADKGVRNRLLSVQNTTDQPVAVTWKLLVNGVAAALLTATLAQDATNTYTLSPIGAKRSDGLFTGVTAAGGDFGLLTSPWDTVTVQYQFGIAPASGSLALSYRGLT